MMLQLILVFVMLIMGTFQTLIIRQTALFANSARVLCHVQSNKLLSKELLAEGLSRLIEDPKITDMLNAQKTIQLKYDPWPESKNPTNLTYGMLRFIKTSATRSNVLAHFYKKTNPEQLLGSCSAYVDYDESKHTAIITHSDT